MTSLPAKLLIAPIRFYQRFITPYTPASCVYYPTCSTYAVTALRTHGAVVGTGLTIWRLLRCNPWSSGGIDHVPSKDQLWHRHSTAAPDVEQQVDCAAEKYSDNQRERGGAAGSSSTVCSAVARSADCDVPPSAARPPMIGRSAA